MANSTSIDYNSDKNSVVLSSPYPEEKDKTVSNEILDLLSKENFDSGDIDDLLRFRKITKNVPEYKILTFEEAQGLNLSSYYCYFSNHENPPFSLFNDKIIGIRKNGDSYVTYDLVFFPEIQQLIEEDDKEKLYDLAESEGEVSYYVYLNFYAYSKHQFLLIEKNLMLEETK